MSDFTFIILNKIEDALKKKELEQYGIEEQEWGNPIGGDNFSKDDSEEDVPNIHDDRPYKTQIIPGEGVREQDEEEKVPMEEPAEGDTNMPPTDTGGGMPPGGDPAAMAAGGDMGMDAGGMGGDPYYEPPKDPRELGRTYELKKIYARLVSIESYLSTSSDVEVLILRKYVSQAIEMFQTISANVESYKDRIDEIIVVFYKFLKLVYSLLDKYFSKKKTEDEKDNNMSNINLAKLINDKK